MSPRRVVLRLIKIGKAEHAYRAVRDQCALNLLFSSLRSHSVEVRYAAAESFSRVMNFTRADCDDIYDALMQAERHERDSDLREYFEVVAALYGDKLALY